MQKQNELLINLWESLKTITFDLQAHMIEHVNVNDIH